MKEKKCPTCGESKLANSDYFSRHLNRYDGLCWQCKTCRKEADRIYRSKAKNKFIEVRKNKNSGLKKLAQNAARAEFGKAYRWKCAVLNCDRLSDELHHVDYSKPLDVVPLCRMHHELEHHK